MGSSSSKLKKRLRKGEEDAALRLLDTNRDLQKRFDPNSSYGDRYGHDTPLHLASRHAMKRTLRLFLFDRGGNPNKKNGKNESSLHCACQLPNEYSPIGLSSREECVNMILQWKGGQLEDGNYEQINLGAQDKLGNTALHYAAQSGFDSCVKTLVDKGSPLFVENTSKQTPCEVAEKAGKFAIAALLESKMVFFDNDENDRPVSPELIINDDEYQGMKPQDLQEVKDTLIVETSDMLRVPLFTAEALLRNHEWSREALLEAWFIDPVGCCEKSGVAPPRNLDGPCTDEYELEISKIAIEEKDFTPKPCEICYEDITNTSDSIPMVCDHTFCRSCWTDYLNIKIKEGDSHNIVCPAYGCHRLVPVELIEKMVSSTMARRYLQFDIKAFVDSNPHIVWCPHADCGLAIQHPDRVRSASVSSRNSVHPSASVHPSKMTVVCSNGHAFCWSCQLEPHEPASCDVYKEWLSKISEVKKDEFQDISKKSETAANIFWMTRFSKKCPNCKSPIEKNEGCNHMRCSKCKHDFCWVCLEPWKWHNSMTGGFFRCTRYEIVEKVDEQHKTEVDEITETHKSLQAMNRFVHYYSRYENHKHSLELEKPLLENANRKMSLLVGADLKKMNAARFLEEAISVLIKARQILQFSYVYGFYNLQDSNVRKMVFELLLTELEEQTEYLSEIIARPYLRTPKAQIVKITRQVAEKTEEFLTAINNGLLPQDLHQLDRHPKANKPGSSSSELWISDSDDSSDDQPSELCKAEGCNNLKLRHSEAYDQHHDYCSLACLKADYLAKSRRKAESSNPQQIDLLQALEMSRLQLLQDVDSLNTGGSSSDVSGDGDTPTLRRKTGKHNNESNDPFLAHVLRLSQSVYAEEQDEDLSLAIEMSLQTAEVQERMMRERAENRRRKAHSHSESLNEGAHSDHNSDGASPLPSTSHGAENVASSSHQEKDRIRARLDELDRAVAQLLEAAPSTSNTESGIRRSESERRTSRAQQSSKSPDKRSDRKIRRSKSERR